MIERFIQKKITNDFERGKIIVVMGARQVGKTTMIQQLSSNGKKLLLNCDDIEDRSVIEDKSSAVLKNVLANYDFVFIDEAQRVQEIGLTLKKIGDLKLKTHVIVSGSSSFELSGNINEPATGRLIEHQLFPFALG
ncbi:MAG: AAA family ATPase, partial [Bacteroidales bacterium]|nr:AAA family ATPase [Bacteroidales bacterium]